jgi:hypothetical protein
MSYKISRFSLKIIAESKLYEKFYELGIPLELLHGDETWSASKVAYER